MTLWKNRASQFVLLRVLNVSTGAAETGDAANISMFVGEDAGALVASANSATELSAANAPGWYRLALSQGETNALSVVVVGNSSTANVEVIGQMFTTSTWTLDDDGITQDLLLEALLAVLTGIATRSTTQTIFRNIANDDDKVTVTHDAQGNRTVSSITP